MAIFGPVLSEHISPSIIFVQRLLNGDPLELSKPCIRRRRRPGRCLVATAGHDQPCCRRRAIPRHRFEVDDRAGDCDHFEAEIAQVDKENAHEDYTEIRASDYSPL